MVMKTIVGLGALAILWLLLTQPWRRIPGPKAQALVQQGAKLIDVRTEGEFADGHLPNAENIPVQRFSEHVSTLAQSDQPIIVYCRSGQRSGRAARMLQDAGAKQVFDLGPMSRWP